MAKIDFNPGEHEPSKGFDLLPTGPYLVTITASDIRATKRGDGQYVWLEYTVLDGPYANRKLWSNHNIQNPNPDAEKIANNELSAICAACGVTGHLDDTSELHDIPIKVSVTIKKDKNGEYADQNQIRSWMLGSVTQQPAAPARPAAPVPPPARQPAKVPPSWKQPKA